MMIVQKVPNTHVYTFFIKNDAAIVTAVHLLLTNAMFTKVKYNL